MDTFSGTVLTRDGFVNGYICVESGKIVAIEDGDCPYNALAKGLIVPSIVNSHTHCADGGLKVSPGMSLEDLVAPPSGLKHKYLQTLTDASLADTIKSFATASHNYGSGTFIDFREGGILGCNILRNTSPESTILGRPVSEEYDPEEIDGILNIADGIGISSISDMDFGYIEKIADHVRKTGKIFAIHASERTREDIDLILSLDPTFVVHMTEATDSDLLKCAETEVPIVICARSNLYFKKTPPIKKILNSGVDVALGTDNAMLCEPDLRAEASVFKDILVSQGGDAEDVCGPAFTQGRKILYPDKWVHLSVGMTADLTILPYKEKFSINSVLDCKEKIFRYTPKEGPR
jgi:Cytosine deaminase and related metal-dependent hydrolases